MPPPSGGTGYEVIQGTLDMSSQSQLQLDAPSSKYVINTFSQAPGFPVGGFGRYPVTNLVLDGNSRVTGVIFFSESGATAVVECFIVCVVA